MYQFQNLATFYGVNIPQQAHANIYTIETVEQLETEQKSPKNQDSYILRTEVTLNVDTSLLSTPKISIWWNRPNQLSNQTWK